MFGDPAWKIERERARKEVFVLFSKWLPYKFLMNSSGLFSAVSPILLKPERGFFLSFTQGPFSTSNDLVSGRKFARHVKIPASLTSREAQANWRF